ncbi:peptidase [Flavobacterium sp.]|uniref:peptidase n=1 Tax=Flavobacterium sp. TaxID=239 RepID=UPI003C6FFD7A
MNVFVFATLGAIVLISITTFIIAFTPLREYIPGYSSSKLKRDATELALKSDSLVVALKKNEAYIQSIQKVLNGQLEYAKFNKDSILNSSEDPAPHLKMTASEEELKLREKVASEEKTPAQLTKKKQPTTKKQK